MAGVREWRKRLSRVAVVLLVIDAAALAVLVSPMTRSPKARLDDYNRLRAELQQKRREALAVDGIDQKLANAERDIARFSKERLPERQSEIASRLGALAREHSASISQVVYASEETELEGLRRVAIQSQLEGNYLQVMRFINALERDRVFFIVNSVQLAEQQQGVVRLQLELETYMAGGA